MRCKFLFSGAAVAAGLLVAGCQSSPPVQPTVLEQAQGALSAGRFKEALKKAELVLQQNDQDVKARYVRGMAAYGLGEFPIAKESLSSLRSFYVPSSVQGRVLLKTLALTHFRLKDFDQAYALYGEFIAAKNDAGSALLDDDLYWAGVMADLNLKNDERDQWWSQLSTSYKKSKGMK